MTFQEIISANPDAGESACEMVYEALTGKCWHVPEFHIIEDGMKPTTYTCNRCGVNCYDDCLPCHNPDLLDSLDAWVPLWERMPDKDAYVKCLIDVLGNFHWEPEDYKPLHVGRLLLEVKAHHHVETCLRTLEEDCPECEFNMSSDLPEAGCPNQQCHNGKVSLYEKWRKECGIE